MQHLSARQAGVSARAAGVGRLVLTHLWPTLDPEQAPVRRGPRRSARRCEWRRRTPCTPSELGREPAVRADGRGPTTCGRCRSSGTTPSSPPGRCWYRWAGPGCCAPPRSTSDVPPWMRGKGKGWVTAEYSMLPGSTPERIDREVERGKPSGRTQEIQRLIGRSLRSVTRHGGAGGAADRARLRRPAGRRRHPHRVHLRRPTWRCTTPCTRLVKTGKLAGNPLTAACAAISVGIVDARRPPRPRLLRGRRGPTST